MYSFSRDFLNGLETKSENFQNNFYGIIDKICSYLDSDEEKQEFQKYIEQHHSYDKPGNMLYSFGTIFGGEQSDCEEFKKEIHSLLLGLFDDYVAADAVTVVPHIIVCVSAADGLISDEDMEFIRNLLNFERLCRGCPPVTVTTILNDTGNNRGTSCFVATLK